MWEVESGASGLKACGLQGLGFKHSALLCREICRQGPEQSRIVWLCLDLRHGYRVWPACDLGLLSIADIGSPVSIDSVGAKP